jgi:hypothetical protein
VRADMFANKDAFRPWTRKRHDFRFNQTVVEHHVRSLNTLHGAQCQKIPRAGAGANQRNMTQRLPSRPHRRRSRSGSKLLRHRAQPGQNEGGKPVILADRNR